MPLRQFNGMVGLDIRAPSLRVHPRKASPGAHRSHDPVPVLATNVQGRKASAVRRLGRLQ